MTKRLIVSADVIACWWQFSREMSVRDKSDTYPIITWQDRFYLIFSNIIRRHRSCLPIRVKTIAPLTGGKRGGMMMCMCCTDGLCELRPPPLSPCCSLSIFVFPFYLILSLCVPRLCLSLFSYRKYRIMTQFSCAARASRETVTIATAPVLLSRPTVVEAWVLCIVLATL